jgi:hypothetical protein
MYGARISKSFASQWNLQNSSPDRLSKKFRKKYFYCGGRDRENF